MTKFDGHNANPPHRRKFKPSTQLNQKIPGPQIAKLSLFDNPYEVLEASEGGQTPSRSATPFNEGSGKNANTGILSDRLLPSMLEDWANMYATKSLPGRSHTPRTDGLAVVDKIAGALKDRCAVLEGRTRGFRRLEYHLDNEHNQGFKQRLFRCFVPDQSTTRLQAPEIIEALEKELYYLVCWNRDSFLLPEEDMNGTESYPPLYHGSYISMFEILRAEGIDVNKLNFNNHQQTASIIFNVCQNRVYKKARESRLLYKEPVQLQWSKVPRDLHPREDEEKKDLKHRKLAALEELSAAPENLLTLAFHPENFHTALVRAMARAGRGVWSDDHIKDEVEVLMYRLGKKEPRAFPEVFFPAEAVNADETPVEDLLSW